MFKKLLSVFEESKPQPTMSVEVASAALLYMLATADNDFDERERQAIKELVTTSELTQDELASLTESAQTAAKESTSIYEFTAILAEQFEYEERVKMISKMWNVAYADGKIDKYEEYLIRRVCDLLYVAHSDFIKSRNSIRDRAR